MAEVDPGINIQVCYATPDNQWIRSFNVPGGTTLAQGIEKSGLLDCGFAIDVATGKVGIFGKLKPRETILREGDRIEVYRSLIADPKESRRKRAEKKVPATSG